MAERTAKFTRKTKETDISLSFNIYNILAYKFNITTKQLEKYKKQFIIKVGRLLPIQQPLQSLQ